MARTPTRPARGRPRAVSRAMLQEAAFECFLEDGYQATTVERIASRAGVSRSTFFGYFTGKSDVFWVELEDALEAVGRAAADPPDDLSPLDLACRCLLAGAERLGTTVPWPLTQHELIGADEELRASAAGIVSAQVAVVEAVLTARSPAADRPDPVLVSAAAGALVGAAVAAIAAWAAAGPGRGPLAPRMATAIAPVRDGFAAVLAG